MSISAPHFLVSAVVGLLVGSLFALLAYFAWRHWQQSQSTDHAAAKLTGFEQVIPGPTPPEEHPAAVPIEDSKDDIYKQISEVNITKDISYVKDLESGLEHSDVNARNWTEELEAAIDAKNLLRLDDVLTEARKSNTCSRGLLERAERLLAELHLRVELEAALREAIKEKNLQALQRNIHAAQAMQEFPASLLEDAGRMLEELQKQLQVESSLQRCEDIETALRAAMIEGDLQALEKLVAEASQYEVNKELLQRAASQIEQLLAKAKMETALRNAMDSGDLDKLLELLSQCLYDPVSFDIIQQAEAVVAALQRNKDIEISLQTAIDGDDLDEIRRILAFAQEAHVSNFLIERAERVLADYQEVERQVRGSIAEKNLASLQTCIRLVHAKNRFTGLLKDAKESASLLVMEGITLEIETAMESCDIPTICEMVIRAEALNMESWALTAAIKFLSKHFKRTSSEISWNMGDEAIPWDESSSSYDLNPSVEISIKGDKPGIHEVQCFLEDLDGAAVPSVAPGDRKHGFVLLANPNGQSSCPTLIPGGAVLASAACNEQGVASAKLELSTGTKIFLGSGEAAARKVFAVASLPGPVVHGGRARFHFWSPVDLSVKLLPSLHERWAYQTSLGGQWLMPASTAGGPISDEGAWLSNPQFRVSLDQGPVPLQLAAVLRVRACSCKAYLHVVQGEGSRSYLAPKSIEILAQGTHKSFQDIQEIVAYFEIEDSTGPFFLVPSLQQSGKGASFDLQVSSNAKLQVQQVRSDIQSLNREGVHGSFSQAAAEALHGTLPASEGGRLDKIKAIFSSEDSHGNGSLDMLEFESLIRKLAEVHGGASLDDEDIEAMFDQCDANGDGTVDFIEFANWAIAAGIQETSAAVDGVEEV